MFHAQNALQHKNDKQKGPKKAFSFQHIEASQAKLSLGSFGFMGLDRDDVDCDAQSLFRIAKADHPMLVAITSSSSSTCQYESIESS